MPGADRAEPGTGPWAQTAARARSGCRTLVYGVSIGGPSQAPLPWGYSSCICRRWGRCWA